MRRVLWALALLLAASRPAGARAAEPLPVRDGPDGRLLLGGSWQFSPDGRRGWTTVTVPNAWNAADDSPASMVGGIGYYRKDFRVPGGAAGSRWLVRFESVNYRMRATLNGRRIGTHTGAYLPFELPLTGLRAGARNRLVVRVDSRRKPWDLPPQVINAQGLPSGGWFNAGGILREVYLRRVRGVDLQRVLVRPELPCPTCAARITMAVRMRAADGIARRVRVSATYGDRRIDLGDVVVPSTGDVVRERRMTLAHPHLWTPADPHLYPVRIDVRRGARRLAGWTLHSGVRSVHVRGGRLELNGVPTSLRGVGYHEDVKGKAMAISRDDRAWLVGEAKALGATMMRTHYPPGEDLLELADQHGMLLWSEIPVYSVKPTYLARPSVRAKALDELRTNIALDQNHPSIVTWSIANELSSEVGPSQAAYIGQAAALAHRLDPTRPVAMATLGYPSTPCQPEYAALDLVGVNEYFGWYTGPGGEVFDRTGLSSLLDARRACYPRQAIMVTEFGAEANRDGPVEEKGTWGFQQEFVDYHLGVFASKPWLSGALYWALNEFRVRPAWEGGNPRPAPPIHQKGLINYDRQRKPAWENVHRWYTGQVPGQPLPSPPPGG